MENITSIFTALRCCAGHENEACKRCPYNGKTNKHMSCRRYLCYDAADMLEEAKARADEVEKLVNERAHLYDTRNMLMAENAALKAENEQMKKPTSVGFDEKKAPEAVGEGLAAIALHEASYWEGQADALKWFLRGYCGLGLDAEVADDV